jgi:hypothetical protein
MATTAAGTQLSALQIAQVARGAGFTGSGLVTAVALALEESGGWSGIVNVNSDKYRSRDRGLWQINDHWHPDVSDADAFSPTAAARAAYAISAGGTSWGAWTAVANGRTAKFTPQAQAAADAVDARSPSGQPVTVRQLSSSTGAAVGIGGGDYVDTTPGPWPGTHVAWALLEAGMSAADAQYALAAAYDANGKRDGFYLPQGAPAVKHSLWPALTPDRYAYIGAHDGTANSGGASRLAAGRITGEGYIAKAAVERFGRAALGSPSGTAVAWARDQVAQAEDQRNHGWTPFDSFSIAEKGGAVEGLGPLPNPLSGIEAVGAAVASIANFLTSAETWKRLGLILGGALVAALGVALLLRSTPAGAGAMKALELAAV